MKLSVPTPPTVPGLMSPSKMYVAGRSMVPLPVMIAPVLWMNVPSSFCTKRSSFPIE